MENKDIVNWIMCLLALVAVALAVVLFLKVNKKCKGEGYDVQPNGFTPGQMSAANIQLCNNSGIIDNENYFCDNVNGTGQAGPVPAGDMEDPLTFCQGNAAIAVDSPDNAGVVGTCSTPFSYAGDENSLTLCCNEDSGACGQYPVGTNTCDSQNPCNPDQSGSTFPGIGWCGGQ